MPIPLLAIAAGLSAASTATGLASKFINPKPKVERRSNVRLIDSMEQFYDVKSKLSENMDVEVPNKSAEGWKKGLGIASGILGLGASAVSIGSGLKGVGGAGKVSDALPSAPVGDPSSITPGTAVDLKAPTTSLASSLEPIVPKSAPPTNPNTFDPIANAVGSIKGQVGSNSVTPQVSTDADQPSLISTPNRQVNDFTSGLLKNTYLDKVMNVDNKPSVQIPYRNIFATPYLKQESDGAPTVEQDKSTVEKKPGEKTTSMLSGEESSISLMAQPSMAPTSVFGQYLQENQFDINDMIRGIAGQKYSKKFNQ